MHTTLNPNEIKFNYPTSFHQSLILVTTPSQLNKIISKSIDDFQNPQMKPISNIIVACCDSILGSRNAYSELYLDDKFIINNLKELKDDEPKLQRDPLSVDPIRLDKNWSDKSVNTNFKINMINGDSMGIKLANTLFANGQHSVCFYIGDGGSKYDWVNLEQLDITINDDIKSVDYRNRLGEIPLVPAKPDDEYTVTDFEGNLIKSINHNSPSQYLIDNPLVMGSKKDLYFKLYDKNQTSVPPYMEEYYKLIVGGLGWGEKQAFLGVDPVVGRVGYRDIKLFEFKKTIQPINPLTLHNSNSIILECAPVEDGFQEHHSDVASGSSVPLEIEGVFSMGCEQGVDLNGVTHRSQGETLKLNM